MAANEQRTLAVVLNWCAEEDSSRSLQALLAQRASMPTLDVMLADSDSPDGSGLRLATQFPGVLYLPLDANLGYAGGNQRAIEWALDNDYAYVLLVNDDAEVTPRCVKQLVAAMQADERVGACAPTITYGPPHEDRLWWAGGRFVWWKALGVHQRAGRSLSQLSPGFTSRRSVTFLSGCVLLLRTEAIRRHGGLRAEFFAYVEDAELCLRWQRAGWTLLWVPGAVARHHVRNHVPGEGGLPSAFAMQWRDRNRLRLAALHYTPLRHVLFLLCFLVTRFVLLVRYRLRGDESREAVLREAWLGAWQQLVRSAWRRPERFQQHFTR